MDIRENSYKGILRGVSIFGGVKALDILVNLLRGKFVAILLGPDGMGVNSIFSSSAQTVSQFSSLGVSMAIVKETAPLHDNPERLRHTAAAAMRLTTLTGIGGALICVLLAPLLSTVSFGTRDYWWQFMLLGIAVYLMVGNGSRLALLQGLHEVKRLSRASLVGSFTGLLAGVPLYWFFGRLGIVPAIILLVLAMHIFYTVSLRRSIPGGVPLPRVTLKECRPIFRRLLGLGIVLVAGDALSTLANWLLLVILRESGGDFTVGLYHASSSVTNQMAGVVFAAMAMDYFPRLSAAGDNNKEMTMIVNRQTEVMAWVILPLSLILIAASPLVIRILFTEAFADVRGLMCVMAGGVLLKAMAFPMAYITIARDRRRLFFWMEGVFANILTLASLWGGFILFGLEGIGYGMILEQSVLIVVYTIVNRRLYGYLPSREALAGLAVAVILVGGAIVSSTTEGLPGTAATIAFAVAGTGFSLLKLRQILKKPTSTDGD